MAGAQTADMRIVLLGKSGSGKSATGNTILGNEEFSVGVSPSSVTTSCKNQQVDVCGRKIQITDTPGLFDTSMTEDQLEAQIEKCVYLSVPGPHAFLLVIRLDVRFTEEERNAVQWIQRHFGEDAVNYTIILFTHADELNAKPLDEYISESNDLQALINQYEGRYHSFNNTDTQNRNQVIELLERIDEMVMRNGGHHYTNEMYNKAQRQITWDNIRNTITDPKNIALAAAVAAGPAAVAAGARAVTAGAAAAGARAVASVGPAALAAAVATGARVVAAGAAAVVSTALQS